jgi:hypothetical protein
MRYFVFINFFFLSAVLYAQRPSGPDISLNNNWVADNNSDAAFQAYSIRVKLLSKPLNQGKSGILNFHATYSYIKIDFKDKQELLDDLQYFHGVGLMMGYIKQLGNPKWSFMGMANPQLNSNFVDGVKGDDFYLNILALFNYSKQKNSRFSLGFAYTNTLGIPAPIPVINYWKAWSDSWEMNFGFPRVNLTHHFNNKNSLIAFSELKGYNGNISKELKDPLFKMNRKAQRISSRDILAGLEWKCKLKKGFQFYINTSYTLNRNFKLQNRNNDTVYKFEMGKNFYFGGGISFSY